MAATDAVKIAVPHAEAEADPLINRVHGYWRALNGGRMVARKAFDFMAIYREAPYLLMAERQGPATFKFVYCGTEVAEHFPLDLTGKSYGPDTPRISKVPWPILFTSVIDTPCVRFGKQTIDWAGPRYSKILYGVFPLSDDSGNGRYALASLVFSGRR